jgi:hypothetical protein
MHLLETICALLFTFITSLILTESVVYWLYYF